MLVLLLHQVTFNELCALHLECEDLGHFVNPCCLTCFIPLSIFIILVVRNFGSEHILPSLVKIVLILNVQDYVVLNFRVSFPLRNLLFVYKLD